jgi:ABC-type Fe3+/spermidine/putrescine transport system ATPase subunit
MEQREIEQQDEINKIYDYTANLFVNEKKSSPEVTKILIEQGLDEKYASIVVANIEVQIKEARKEQANKDMLYGALWCVGGIVLTISGIGFIFWGAIVFGGYQFLKGVVNSI